MSEINEHNEKWISIDEAAEFLGVKPGSLIYTDHIIAGWNYVYFFSYAG